MGCSELWQNPSCWQLCPAPALLPPTVSWPLLSHSFSLKLVLSVTCHRHNTGAPAPGSPRPHSWPPHDTAPVLSILLASQNPCSDSSLERVG